MAFVQIIELTTSKFDELLALDAEWEKATEGKRKARRVITTTDRNNPKRHLIFAFFDSYEEAMENSDLPETQEYAPRMSELADGPLVFHDLDIVEERSL